MNKPFVPPMAPWSPASDGLLPPPVSPFDPRIGLSDEALALASRNAYPVIAKHKARSDSFGLLAGAAVALVLGGITFASMNSGRNEKTSAVTSLAPPRETLLPSRRPVALPPGAGMPLPAIDMGHPQPATMGAPIPAPATVPVPLNGTANGSAPTVVFDTSSRSAAVAAGRPSVLLEEGGPALLAGTSGVHAAGNSDANSARSSAMADPANTIVQGTLIPAVLETAIHSDLPGYARAVVSQDVRSFDGSKILVPRSSRLIGEYKGGITAGQKRVYLMWTRLVRPDGVSIALASPAVDSEGQSGIGGKVNDHFLQRFGSAILLSLLGRASAIGSGGATVVLSGGGQSAASVALQHDGQRAPTIHIMQGEPIRVFTARDLIFASSDGARG